MCVPSAWSIRTCTICSHWCSCDKNCIINFSSSCSPLLCTSPGGPPTPTPPIHTLTYHAKVLHDWSKLNGRLFIQKSAQFPLSICSNYSASRGYFFPTRMQHRSCHGAVVHDHQDIHLHNYSRMT